LTIYGGASYPTRLELPAQDVTVASSITLTNDDSANAGVIVGSSPGSVFGIGTAGGGVGVAQAELWLTNDALVVTIAGATNETARLAFTNALARLAQLDGATNATARLAFTNSLALLAQLDGATNATARLAFTNNLALLAQLDGATNETARLAFTNSLARLAQLDGSTNETARLAFTNALARLAQLDGATNETARLAFTNSLALLTQLDGSTNATARLAFTNSLALLAQLDGATNIAARAAFTNGLALLTQLDGSTNIAARAAFTNGLALLVQLDGATNIAARAAFTNNLVQKGTTVVALGITSNTAASVTWTPGANVWTNSSGANTLHTATNASGARLVFYWDYSITANSTNTAVGFVITNSTTGFTMPYLITGASGMVVQGTMRVPCSTPGHIAWSNVWTLGSVNTSKVTAVRAVVE
jgi:hypothetical protein